MRLGSGGLTGRPLIRPPAGELEQPVGFDEQGNPVFAEPPAPGPALPGTCLRVLTVPNAYCQPDCPGLQRDGSCLCDIVRAANERGEEWKFEIDEEGYWNAA